MKYYIFEYNASMITLGMHDSIYGCCVIEFHHSFDPVKCYNEAIDFIENKVKNDYKELAPKSIKINIVKMTPTS